MRREIIGIMSVLVLLLVLAGGCGGGGSHEAVPRMSALADTGVRYPGAATSNSEGWPGWYDDETWVSPGNVTADDANYASITASSFDNGDRSYVLRATNFGFGIPTGNTIKGIKVEIERRCGAGSARDALVQLTKDGSVRVGNNKANTSSDWPGSVGVATYGNSTDLWGTTWTREEINASTFGVHFAAQAYSADTDIYVDFIRITVYYAPTVYYTITASAGTGGSISPSGAVLVQEGNSQTFNITPATGYIVSDVVVNTTTHLGRVNSHTFTAVSANHTIAASFDGGWTAPSADRNDNSVLGEGNAYASDDYYAVFNDGGDQVDYYDFGLSIPSGATINGIELAVEGDRTSGRTLNILLSSNGDAGSPTWTLATNLAGFTSADSTMIAGGPSSLWGRSWSYGDFADPGFTVRADATGGGGDLNIDQIQVKVYYTACTTEVCNDGIDNDCDGDIDCNDSDCPCAPCYSCNATTGACYYNPPAEICGNGIDDDCDGLIDCNDSDCPCAPCYSCNATSGACYFNPPAEICGNGIDDDCDGLIDCNDAVDCPCAPCYSCNATSGACYFNPPAEICGNGIDDDCDGLIDCNDAVDCPCAPCYSCNATSGACYFNPPAEICGNGIDDDCDGLIDCNDAVDCPCAPCYSCNATSGACYFNPPAESCSDGIDNDCDGLIDCNDAVDCPCAPCYSCNATSGACYFNPPAEICGNGIDDDCDGLIDCNDAVDCPCAPCYSCNATSGACYFNPPAEICGNGIDDDCDGLIDCNDAVDCPCAPCYSCNATSGACYFNPPAEICGNGIDDDCDGLIDCNDAVDCPCAPCYSCNATSGACYFNPPAEICGNGIDDDCDGLIDCNDAVDCPCAPCYSCNATSGACYFNPSAEICGNGIDDDCDGLIDCNDAVDCPCAPCYSCNATSGACYFNPPAEICGNGIDDDCDGLIDCNDAVDCPCAPCYSCNATSGACYFNPPAEICGNGIDDDCDGLIDCNDAVDCPCAPCYSCNATSGACYFNPPAEICGNGIDDDCDGLIDCNDAVDCPCAPCYSCNATSGACYFNPPAESCSDGIDNDCDGLIDCNDPDCPGCGPCYSCNVTSGACYFNPPAESCSDGIDNDCDGLIDCNDPDCPGCGPCYSCNVTSGACYFNPPAESCSDGIDNDCDGLIDCNDPDCPGCGPCYSCNVTSGACYFNPPAESCNGVDDNCDGSIDEGCTYNISGTIQVGGTPLAGVLVTGHSNPWTGNDITGADGKYELTGVPSGETNILITPTLAGYTFSPPTILVTGPVSAPLTNQDFNALSWTYAPAYGLIISSTEGGSVTTPGEGAFPYLPGFVVDLVASPDAGYKFVNWLGDVATIADVHDALTTITMEDWHSITANFETEEIPPVELPVYPPVYPTVTTQAAATASPTTLNMKYTVGDFSLVQVRFAYKKSADSSWSYTDWVSKSASGTYAELLSGLASITEYDFKAQLRYNSTVIDGNILHFTTAIQHGCFIATAAYGTPTAEQIDVLREFRDVVLLESTTGSQFVALYYQLSPPAAEFIAENELVRTLVRELLVDPIVWVVEATGDIWRN